jgi:hypothetical protein
MRSRRGFACASHEIHIMSKRLRYIQHWLNPQVRKEYWHHSKSAESQDTYMIGIFRVAIQLTQPPAPSASKDKSQPSIDRPNRSAPWYVCSSLSSVCTLNDPTIIAKGDPRHQAIHRDRTAEGRSLCVNFSLIQFLCLTLCPL